MSTEQTQPGEVGATDEQPLRTSDPARIRALAHPVRLDLIAFLDEVGEATATQCADRLGETVANCSFHLRTLAKAGFIEPAPARGREKPWRPTSRGRRIRIDPEQPGSQVAIAELVGLAMLREAERVRGFLQRQEHRPEAWKDTVAVTTSMFWATADEMRELVAAVNDLTDRFEGRADDPSLRPVGARIGRLFATVNPDDFPTPDEVS